MPVMPTRELKSDIVLLIEGNDETNFFSELLKAMGITSENEIQTISVGGKNQFPNEFPAFLNDPNFSRVTAYAIIRDADNSAKSALESIQNLLRSNNQPCPQAHGQFAYNNEGSLKVGIYIMPGNTQRGMLEDICLQSVMDHPIWPYVEQYIMQVQSVMQEKAPRNVSKAKLQTFLAGMPRVDERLGIAAKWNYFPFEHEAFSGIRSFIDSLLLPCSVAVGSGSVLERRQ